MAFKTTIVIPAYNEERRLPRTLDGLKQAISDGSMQPLEITEVIIVDDGSGDQTVATAKSYVQSIPQLRVVELGRNFGKGRAVHEGIRSATQDWVLVADADMATPWFEGANLARLTENSKADIAIASRDLAESKVNIRQSWIRETMGKTFNLIVRAVTRLPYRDTQCGFKLFRREPVQNFASVLQVDRFAWDVEFLMVAKKAGLQIIEVPVSWEHQEESRVHPILDAANMFFVVVGLRFRLAKTRLKP